MNQQEQMDELGPLSQEVLLEILKYPEHYQPSLKKYALQGVSPSQAYEELKDFEAFM